MLAEIITIGDEILIGQIVDTNSAWMAIALNQIGVSVKQITSISDHEQHILEALQNAEGRADLIIMTGGLGPTKDDITKKTLAKFFDSKTMIMHAPTLDIVENIFKKYNAPLLEVNKQQAMVPDNCEVIINEQGTAPGLMFQRNGKTFISMPGVPYEMKYLMRNKVLPLITSTYQLPKIYHRTILTAGIGESFLAEKLKDIESELPSTIKLAYLPKLGTVRLRLSTTTHSSDELMEEVEAYANRMEEIIVEHVVASSDIALELAILQYMKDKNITLSLAESCTGGAISQLFTQHPGCSKVFKGGAVVYSNELKTSVLGVKRNTIEQYGAVSEETVREMCSGALTNFKTDYVLAVSGIAGPDGGTAEKPVGTVYIGVANAHQQLIRKFTFGNKRQQNIERSAAAAMYLLFRFLKQFHKDV